jgi:hypothetical protein
MFIYGLLLDAYKVSFRLKSYQLRRYFFLSFFRLTNQFVGTKKA